MWAPSLCAREEREASRRALCESVRPGMMRTRMDAVFYINPRTGAPHCLDHGVTEDEVLDVLDAPEVRATAHGDALLAAGQTAEGRWIRVIYTVRDGDVRLSRPTRFGERR